MENSREELRLTDHIFTLETLERSQFTHHYTQSPFGYTDENPHDIKNLALLLALILFVLCGFPHIFPLLAAFIF